MALQTKITRNSGFRLFLQSVIGRAYPRIIGTQRDLAWLFFDIFLPFISMVAYVFIYRALKAPEEYIGFVVLGSAMTAYWLNILWAMSSQLYWEKETGNLALYVISPASMMAILFGMASGGLFATTVRALFILIIGNWLFQVSYTITSFWALFLVFILTMVALYGLGMMLSSLFLLFNREAWHTANLLQAPVMLFSGFYFPVKVFNFWIAAAASLIPLTLGMDAIRQLVFPSGALLGFLTVKVELIVLAVLSVVFLAGAYFTLRWMEKLAIRYGRITDRLG
ncbi:MAG TPA: ABC transporter permease [Anaerolineaceae bacterium]|nr:ABC transporter permease [Anaerolineaceae bacterium]HOA21982.1 ABC transporter permease [Anaerolineaceae bacterium]HOG77481.1 ABC transporter permease [Anaerolineaceae bacterium]